MYSGLWAAHHSGLQNAFHGNYNNLLIVYEFLTKLKYIHKPTYRPLGRSPQRSSGRFPWQTQQSFDRVQIIYNDKVLMSLAASGRLTTAVFGTLPMAITAIF